MKDNESVSHTTEPPWLSMVREYVEIHGDPFAPHRGLTNYIEQTGEIHCCGCKAIGETSWPEWKVKIGHEPGCGWLAWRRMIDER